MLGACTSTHIAYPFLVAACTARTALLPLLPLLLLALHSDRSLHPFCHVESFGRPIATATHTSLSPHAVICVAARASGCALHSHTQAQTVLSHAIAFILLPIRRSALPHHTSA